MVMMAAPLRCSRRCEEKRQRVVWPGTGEHEEPVWCHDSTEGLPGTTRNRMLDPGLPLGLWLGPDETTALYSARPACGCTVLAARVVAGWPGDRLQPYPSGFRRVRSHQRPCHLPLDRLAIGVVGGGRRRLQSPPTPQRLPGPSRG